MYLAPLRSSSRKRMSIFARPVCSQSSIGVSTGISISWPPIASISSRMICSTFWCTRQPRGRKLQSPAPTWRMKPPRTSSWCDAASASAGGSRRVGRNSCEAFAIIRCRLTLVERDHRGLSHCQGRRLCHLEPLRPVHAVGDPLVDLGEQLVDKDFRLDLLQDTAVRVDETDVAAAGDPEVRVPRL